MEERCNFTKALSLLVEGVGGILRETISNCTREFQEFQVRRNNDLTQWEGSITWNFQGNCYRSAKESMLRVYKVGGTEEEKKTGLASTLRRYELTQTFQFGPNQLNFV